MSTTDIDTREIAGAEPDPPEGPSRKVVRGLGEVLITLGLVVLLFVFYQVYVTNWFASREQQSASDALDKAWRNGRGDLDLIEGQGMARMYIPALGADYHFVVFQGTAPSDLDTGPGHYMDTALPGKRGNFAVAGHRVGKGAPFNDINLIKSCDAIIVETKNDWLVYRMLPRADEMADWAAHQSENPHCAKVAPLGNTMGPQYKDSVGQEIVAPTQNDVIAPVPHHADSPLPKQRQAALLTLTTCHPRFSARERLIVHAVLVKDSKKDMAHPDRTPPELEETG